MNKAFIQAVKRKSPSEVSKQTARSIRQRSRTWLTVLCLTLLVSGAFQQLKAQTTTSNLATQANASASTTDNLGLFNWNLINDGNISACGSGQEAFIWGEPGQNNMSMRWVWSKQVRTDEMVFHHELGDRTLTGFTLQSWDGSQWVDEKQFSGITSSPGVCSTSITFQRIRTSRIRLINFKMTEGSVVAERQLSGSRNHYRLNTDGWTPGVYLLHIVDQQQRSPVRITVYD